MGERDFSRYVAIPYREHGRDYTGVDCFGLVQLVLRELYSRELPDADYDNPIDFERNAHLVDPYCATIDAEPVEEPQPGDIVLMQYGGMPSHIGVYLEGGVVLHAHQIYGVVMERIDAPRVKNRIVGYYRV